MSQGFPPKYPMPAILSDQEVLIALGSNLAAKGMSSYDLVAHSVEILCQEWPDAFRVSRYYATPCFPAGAGPDFVNAAVALRSRCSPQSILKRLHAIEADLGRLREKRWGARAIDLDLVAVGDSVLPDEAGFAQWRDLPPDRQTEIAPDDLVLPHPRLQDRAFVLVPLCDVAPDWRHPVSGRTVREMRDSLPEKMLDEVVPL